MSETMDISGFFEAKKTSRIVFREVHIYGLTWSNYTPSKVPRYSHPEALPV